VAHERAAAHSMELTEVVNALATDTLGMISQGFWELSSLNIVNRSTTSANLTRVLEHF